MATYTYDGCCGSCIYMNTNDYVNHKDHCYCTYRRQYYNLTESKCRYYSYDSNKDYYDLNHRWHIVSSIFKKLGLYDLEYDCINILENFRTGVLEKDNKYTDILNEYDIIGPAIANFITNDENSTLICKEICSTTLLEVLDLIKKENYDEALKKYMQLVNILKEYYQDKLNEYLEEKQIKSK